MTLIKKSSLLAIVLAAAFVAASCGQQTEEGGSDGGAEGTQAGGGSGGGEALVIYSGREQELIDPIIERFSEESGVETDVRYGDTAELAATILEEGENSPADVFYAQDPGALGALAEAGAFEPLPDELLNRVDERFRGPEGEWVGISGRSRVVAYNTDALSEEELPESILDFTDPEWEGRIGWAPTNGSFQAFVTALRAIEGEDVAREWLEGIQANDPLVYQDNTTTLEGAARGEVDVGFVNHYYLFQALDEQGEGFGARNYYLEGGDPGALVLVSGAGMLGTAENTEGAEKFLDFMLSEEAQQYLADETFEYPMIEGVETSDELVPLEDIQTPEVDFSDLDDLDGTLELMRETGVL